MATLKAATFPVRLGLPSRRLGLVARLIASARSRNECHRAEELERLGWDLEAKASSRPVCTNIRYTWPR